VTEATARPWSGHVAAGWIGWLAVVAIGAGAVALRLLMGAVADSMRQSPYYRQGWYRPEVLDRMARQAVVERTRFGFWDVVVASESARVTPEYVATFARPAALTAGGTFALDGYALERTANGRGVVLRLFWRALRQPDFDYSAAAHLVDAGGRLVAQQDHAPGEVVGNPPARWAPGDVVVDAHRLVLPPGAPAGGYRLRIGVYDWRNGQPLPIEGPGRAPEPVAFLDDAIDFGP
jgi:hypothetical protein